MKKFEKQGLIKNLATCFGVGNSRTAPGTMGTLCGIPIYLVLLFLKRLFTNEKLFNSFYFLFLILFFVLAVYISDICEREIYLRKDPQAVVIDEVFGFLTTLFLINPATFFQIIFAIVFGFLLFRFFDITKIGPINSSQKLKDGVGVVMDDFLAGVAANFVLIMLWSFIF